MADISNSSPRPLPFPLKDPLTFGGFNPDNPLAIIPLGDVFTDNETKVKLQIELSLEEYIALASTIDVGRDIAYNEDREWIWDIWVRALRGVCTMTCEDVADCIENNEAVQNALSAFMSGSGSGGTGTGGDAGAGANTTIVLTNNPTDILAGGSCTNDNMYAVASRIVELAFDAVTQLYQIIDLAQSPLELATEIADNAPAVATAIPATAGDFLVWVQDTAWDSWTVFDTVQRRIDVSCDIFCIMVEQDCVLTFDDLFEYFAGKTLTAIFGVTLESILLDMVDIFATDEVGYTSLAFVFGMLSLGSKVTGIQNVGGFLTAIAAYIDETNNNWELECDECVEPPSFTTIEYDFEVSDGGWTQQTGGARGVWSSGVGWVTENPSGSMGMIIQLAIPVDCEITKVRANIEYDGTNTWAYLILLRNNPNSSSGQVTLLNSSGAPSPSCLAGSTVSAHRDYLVFSLNTGDTTNQGRLKNCVIEFTGTPPTGYQDTDVDPDCP
jgi:hypothetical protein